MRPIARFKVAVGILAVVGSFATAAVAQAGHTITPGHNPDHVNPWTTLHYGFPGADPLRSDAIDSCDADRFQGRPGTHSLRAFLQRYWKRGTDLGFGSPTCRGSLHDEGRAFDFGLDYWNLDDRAEGNKIVGFFTKADAGGTSGAMARRFGIQEIIWNCKIWTANYPYWREYFPGCAESDTASKTTKHRDHVHMGQNWPGARRNRTAWTGYNPCWAGHGGCGQ